MIPKIIHQLWLQGVELVPEKYKPEIEKIKRVNQVFNEQSEWKYILWDEKRILDLIKSEPKLLEKYYKYEYLHQKVDFSKFIILWKYGGIFLDIDVQIVKPFNQLFDYIKDYDFIVSEMNNLMILNFFTCKKFSNCLNNGIYIAKPNSDILKYLYENLPIDTFIPTKLLKIHLTTGPYSFNNLFNEYKNNDSRINKSKILVLPYEYLEPCNSVIGLCPVTNNTYVKHVHAMSWVPNYTIKIIEFYKKGDYKNMFLEFISSPYFTFLLILIVLIFIYFKLKSSQSVPSS
jgi:mannosyltransferase OCH1-like enzyme